jgi:hypothetical protein
MKVKWKEMKVVSSRSKLTLGDTDPFGKYDNNQSSDLILYRENTTPFKQYPLPASPLKSITPFKYYPLPASPLKSSRRLVPSVTPVQRFTPRQPRSAIKSLLAENNVFAISPGMFPRKTQRIDYLDILADAERKEFVSPIKTIPKLPLQQHESETLETEDNEHPEIADAGAEEGTIEVHDDHTQGDGIPIFLVLSDW